MTDTVLNAFLGGRLQIRQPARGYRAGADAVMLAAACPAAPGQSVLELGCGVGVALLCLGRRIANLSLAGMELQPDHAAIALRNAEENGIAARILSGDLAEMPAELRSRSFDHVIANPPYFTNGTPAPESARMTARHEATLLQDWIGAGLRRLKPGGTLTLIQRADRLPEMLAILHGRAGAIAILPIAARQGRDAGRVIVNAKKGSKAGATLLAPFIMHQKTVHDQDVDDLTPDAQAILREAGGINLSVCKIR